MLIRRGHDMKESEVTDESFYWNRRDFIGTAAASALAAMAPLGPWLVRNGQDDKLTPYDSVTSYNNFYEFGTGKDDPERNAHTLQTRPWTVAVEGEVSKPKVFDIDEILKSFPSEERIYRLRCVEAWSMVIPVGRSSRSASLLKRCRAHIDARKFVAFETIPRPLSRPSRPAAQRPGRGPTSKACGSTKPCTR